MGRGQKIKKGLKAIRKKIPGYSYLKDGKRIRVKQHFRTYYTKAKTAARKAGSLARKHKTKTVLGVLVLPTAITVVKFRREMKKRGVSNSDAIAAAKAYTKRYGKRAYIRRIIRMMKERGEGKSFFDEYARWIKKWKPKKD